MPGKNVSIACSIVYVRQKAPTVPSFSRGSPCLTARVLCDTAPGTCGHADISRQSAYVPRTMSAEIKGASLNLK